MIFGGLTGAPAIFFWMIGGGRKARLAACGRCVQQLSGDESRSLTELAAATGLTPGEAAWCINRAIRKGWVESWSLDLQQDTVRRIAPPPVAPPPVAPPPSAAAPEALEDEVADAYYPLERAEDSEPSEELIRRRLHGHRRLLRDRKCAHCDYQGQMGVVREIKRDGTRMAGKLLHGVMGRSGMSRLATRSLREQKNQVEAICPNCERHNTFNDWNRS